MSLVAELAKLQERKDALLREVDLINKELDQVALMVGTKKPSATVHHHHSGLGTTKPRRATRGDNYRLVTHWLRMQATAKTAREISEGTLVGHSSVHNALSNHRRNFIHRGSRWGVSEKQFADHTAELEEQSHGSASVMASMSLIVPSLTGTTDTLNASKTTASTEPDGIDAAKDAKPESTLVAQSIGDAEVA